MKPKMIIDTFEEMLRQMSPYFTISEIVSVLFVAFNITSDTFLLHMQNGEYWFVTNNNSFVTDNNDPMGKKYQLFKFPPPIPSFDQFPWDGKAIQVEWNPDDLNEYLKTNGCSETLYMPDHDREETR